MRTAMSHSRWLRFSLRTLLVFVLLASVPLGWFAWKLKQADRQRKAVAAILKTKACVYFDYQYDSRGRIIDGATAKPNGPHWLRELVGRDFFDGVYAVDAMMIDDIELKHVSDLPGLKCIWLTSAPITNTHLVHLERLTGLQHIYLDGTQITDGGLTRLRQLQNLELLDLSGTHVTDAGLAHVRALTTLRTLRLSETKVTDRGVEHLASLTNLEYLDLRRTQVTDVGVRKLEELTKLDRVCLYGTKVTEGGLRQLQQSLPNCKIEHH